VRHAEIFFAPQNHTDCGVPFETVVTGIHRALTGGERRLGLTFAYILPSSLTLHLISVIGVVHPICLTPIFYCQDLSHGDMEVSSCFSLVRVLPVKSGKLTPTPSRGFT
jgi:hypothetical protein